jgi:pimeloyl-ACP methyl ester carboxylesterase
VVDDPAYLPMVEASAGYLERSARCVVLESSAVTGTNWLSLSEQVYAQLLQLGVRQASLIGIGACATLAQSIALREPKLVRSMVVVDAATRPHPSRWERVVDAIERRLPFGLPLRLGMQGFNVRSFSHRFRCPLLLITTRRAGSFVREELRAFADLAPTAWRVDLSAVADEGRQVAETLEAFQSTPAKCPQRPGR